MKKLLGIVVLGLLLSGNANAGGITVKVYLDAMSRNNKELTASVKKHLVADVPIGIFLSSGVDSTLLASIASKTIKNFLLFGLKINLKILNFSLINNR